MICLSVCTRPFEVRDNWRDPDGIETHVLDVIQVIYDAFVGATTIPAVLRIASRPRPICKCEPVRDKLVTIRVRAERDTRKTAYLVNRAAAPITSGRRKRRDKKGGNSKSLEGTHGWGERTWKESE